MLFSRRRLVPAPPLVCVIAAVVIGATFCAPRPAVGLPPAERPRLAVLLVFDQLRGDYLTRWQALFGRDGFRRLERDGTWFCNCHFPYADTVTAAGHASVAAGCSPAEHGIVGNEWYDRAGGKSVYCVSAERPYAQVPPPPPSLTGDLLSGKKAGVSPERLLAPTLGDALKEATRGKGRVVSLSLKDRSAVLPAGKRPDACYWFNAATGGFVTSSYYRDRVHPWVEAANRDRPADQFFGKDWNRLRTDLDYERFSGPDGAPGTAAGFAQGRAFPHPLTGGLAKPGRMFYEAVTNSPWGNDLLLDLVKRAVDGERLGRGGAPDFLAVSFSSNDLIGHCWGPDSPEVLDVTLRTDLLVADLLTFLDDRVGKGRYVVALTADHGICPLPEAARARGLDAGRIDPGALSARAEAFLKERFGRKSDTARWLEATPYPWVYLNRRTLEANGAKEADVEEALARWFTDQPGILSAHTRTRLVNGVPADDVIAQRVRRSFYPDRCGDVAVVQKPYYLFSSPLGTGTTHGTPHDYDTHVPLVVYGPGIAAGDPAAEAVMPEATAAVLARALGVPPPAQATAAVPHRLQKP